MKKSLRDFDPAEVARLDTEMWQAYYSHHFGRLLLLLFKLFRSQFGTNLYSTSKIAYFSVCAAMTFRKSGNKTKTLKYLAKFFSEISKNSSEEFDPQKAAQLELQWWLIHRYPEKYQTSLESSLAQAMAELYKIDPKELENYGRARALAMYERDGQKEPDWNKIRKCLEDSYVSLKSSVTL